MPVFVYSIAADQHRPSEGDGFVRAETIQQAVALVGHPDVNVYQLPADAHVRDFDRRSGVHNLVGYGVLLSRCAISLSRRSRTKARASLSVIGLSGPSTA